MGHASLLLRHRTWHASTKADNNLRTMPRRPDVFPRARCCGPSPSWTRRRLLTTYTKPLQASVLFGLVVVATDVASPDVSTQRVHYRSLIRSTGILYPGSWAHDSVHPLLTLRHLPKRVLGVSGTIGNTQMILFADHHHGRVVTYGASSLRKRSMTMIFSR